MNPPLVLGPIIHNLQSLDALNTSNQRIRDIMTGKAKETIPETVTFIWVDVRDLALAHVKAAELEEAGGKRFFITAGYFSNREIANIIRERFPDSAENVPESAKGGDYPEGGMGFCCALKGFDADLPGIYKYDNSRSMEVLGIKYRSLGDSIEDTVKSLKAVGA